MSEDQYAVIGPNALAVLGAADIFVSYLDEDEDLQDYLAEYPDSNLAVLVAAVRDALESKESVDTEAAPEEVHFKYVMNKCRDEELKAMPEEELRFYYSSLWKWNQTAAKDPATAQTALRKAVDFGGLLIDDLLKWCRLQSPPHPLMKMLGGY